MGLHMTLTIRSRSNLSSPIDSSDVVSYWCSIHFICLSCSNKVQQATQMWWDYIWPWPLGQGHIHRVKSEIYLTKHPWVCPKYELNIWVYLNTSRLFLRCNCFYTPKHLRKRTISCKQVYLVDTLSGMGHITGVHAGIPRYTININMDTQVHTSYMPGVTY